LKAAFLLNFANFVEASGCFRGSADDERDPAELGMLQREIGRIKHGRYVLLPTGSESRGHGTAGNAKLWKHYLAEFLEPPVQAAK
jgi:hypothetical protein